MSETITAYITKDALSGVVYEVEAKFCPHNPEWVAYADSGCGTRQYASKGDWHRTKEAAVQRVKFVLQCQKSLLQASIGKLDAVQISFKALTEGS